jgi:hypothetical protein
MSNPRATERAWVESWQRAGKRLSELRKAGLRAISTEQALIHLAGAFESCRLHRQPAPTSGLVQQQRWFSKLRT